VSAKLCVSLHPADRAGKSARSAAAPGLSRRPVERGDGVREACVRFVTPPHSFIDDVGRCRLAPSRAPSPRLRDDELLHLHDLGAERQSPFALGRALESPRGECTCCSIDSRAACRSRITAALAMPSPPGAARGYEPRGRDGVCSIVMEPHEQLRNRAEIAMQRLVAPIARFACQAPAKAQTRQGFRKSAMCVDLSCISLVDVL
jgi:hypothetical protein